MSKFRLVLQSIGAVIAGYLVASILTAIMIAALGALFPESYRLENLGWVVFNVLYSCAFAVIGGYMIARLAPSRPFTHATVLGVLMALFALMYTRLTTKGVWKVQNT